MSLRIGLVLAALPSSSETFIDSKIDILVKSGNQVILFVPKARAKRYQNAKVIYAWPIKLRNINFSFVIDFIRLITIRVNSLIRFIQLELKDGSSIMNILKKVYLNGSILSRQLDWLHFDFAALAVERENVAESIQAQMGLSIRGFDVCISPLKYPGIYKKLWSKKFKLHYISDDLLQRAVDLGYQPNGDHVKVTPAVDTSKFDFEREFNSNSKIEIITVARLHWKKGLDYALHAMSELKKRNISFHYNIIGSGKEYEHLCFLINQLGLVQDVSLFGKKSHDEINVYLKGAHFFLMPSVSEGFCNAVLEAQSSGLLCIVTDAEGLSENVLNNITGWVVPKRNPMALADKIEEVRSMNATQKNTISKNARTRIKEQFDLTVHEREWLEFYGGS